MIDWQPMETAPTDGAKVLAAARYTDAIHYVWPSELSERGSTGKLYFKAWYRPVHPGTDHPI